MRHTRGPGSTGTAMDELLRALCSGICHQAPDRSLAPGGWLQPVCARCGGIYTAFLLTGLLVAGVALRARRGPGRWPVLLAGAAGAVFAADLAWSMASGASRPPLVRYGVGAAGGYFLAVALAQLVAWREGPWPETQLAGQATVIVGSALLAGVAALTLGAEARAVGAAHAVVTVIGVVALLASLNIALLGVAWTEIRTGVRRAARIAAGTALALGELAVLAAR